MNTETISFESVSLNQQGEIIAKRINTAELYKEIFDDISLEMIRLPGGTFLMGSPETETGHSPMEEPQHLVTIPPFYMGRFAVTQTQYEAVMGENPAQIKHPARPVECVNWNEATEFCRQLTKRAGRTYRLPTEAEWEYACRAGTKTPFSFGTTLTDAVANYYAPVVYAAEAAGAQAEGTAKVGTLPPNNFGLHEMHANLFEWCEDFLHENYMGAPADESAWIENALPGYRVLRGGSWVNFPVLCRSGFRFGNNPVYRSVAIGFRIVSSVL